MRTMFFRLQSGKLLLSETNDNADNTWRHDATVDVGCGSKRQGSVNNRGALRAALPAALSQNVILIALARLLFKAYELEVPKTTPQFDGSCHCFTANEECRTWPKRNSSGGAKPASPSGSKSAGHRRATERSRGAKRPGRFRLCLSRPRKTY